MRPAHTRARTGREHKPRKNCLAAAVGTSPAVVVDALRGRTRPAVSRKKSAEEEKKRKKSEEDQRAAHLSVVVVLTPDKHALGVAYSVRRREVECSVYVDEHAEAEASLDS
jgi:hypothetical protein